jgi:hypothetical protein
LDPRTRDAYASRVPGITITNSTRQNASTTTTSTCQGLETRLDQQHQLQLRHQHQHQQRHQHQHQQQQQQQGQQQGQGQQQRGLETRVSSPGMFILYITILMFIYSRSYEDHPSTTTTTTSTGPTTTTTTTTTSTTISTRQNVSTTNFDVSHLVQDDDDRTRDTDVSRVLGMFFSSFFIYLY